VVASRELLQFQRRSGESCRRQKLQLDDWHNLWRILFVFRTRDLLCEYYTNGSVFREHDLRQSLYKNEMIIDDNN
jgi:hypothetical protein